MKIVEKYWGGCSNGAFGRPHPGPESPPYVMMDFDHYGGERVAEKFFCNLFNQSKAKRR